MKSKTVIFLCGLIGSGKTTYANSHFRNVTDLDNMHDYARKKDQISWTKNLLKINDEVCHITTYPTDEELSAFAGIDMRFIYIDTSVNQCKTNVLIRNRQRDMNNIHNVFTANIEYEKTFNQSQLPFEKIYIFNR